MLTKDQIKTVYTNARELVRANNPKAARSYVLLLLNDALERYKNAPTILAKAKLAAFMDFWIAVSCDLYDKGITDFVLESFGLMPKKAVPKTAEPPREKNPSAKADDGEIDFAGLIEETRDTQGWCAEVFEKNKLAVAEISATGNGQSSSGTGFIISPKGYMLTNDHVVFDGASGVYYPRIYMKLHEEEKKIKTEVLFSDKKADVALCKFNTEEVGRCVSVKRVADYSSLLQGADCLVIGNAFGMGLAPFSGVVRFTKDSDGNLVYTAPSNPGDSGAPVFNRKGECIGINKSKTVKVNERVADGIANATPMDAIEKLLNKWISHNNIEL